jgi:two-component system response regulator HydG
MVVLSRGPVLELDSVPEEILKGRDGAPRGSATQAGMSMEESEIELIRNTLKMTKGNREEAARILKIGERTLYRKLKQYKLTEVGKEKA